MARKYRPYLTLAELSRIRDLLKDNSAASIENANLYEYFRTYIIQIDLGVRSHNHTTKPTIEERLGFGEPEPILTHEAEQQRRYLEDEMSPEEEQEYEAKLMREGEKK